jgi:hypothetical protein
LGSAAVRAVFLQTPCHISHDGGDVIIIFKPVTHPLRKAPVFDTILYDREVHPFITGCVLPCARVQPFEVGLKPGSAIPDRIFK